MGSQVVLHTTEGKVQTAQALFEKMINDGPKPNAVTCNTLIDGYFILNKIVDAEGMFKLMENAGLCPNSVAYNILINGYGSCGKIEEGFSMLKAMIQLFYMVFARKRKLS